MGRGDWRRTQTRDGRRIVVGLFSGLISINIRGGCYGKRRESRWAETRDRSSRMERAAGAVKDLIKYPITARYKMIDERKEEL